jgi:triacylglycerol esterase/lipase EstA (alpha/beta hydrolase family)
VLDSLSSQRRRMVLGVGVLLGLLVLVAGGLVVRSALDRPDPVAQDELGPVLLVAGYGGNTRALEPLRRALEEQGRTVLVVPPVGRNTGSLEAQAAVLDRTARSALSDRPDEVRSVDVVGYSAGGVVARLWVAEHGGDELARRVLTIGSPHHGAALAGLASSFGQCPAACRELAPASDLIRRLAAGDETPAGPRWVSVWSTADRVSSPPETARLEGALDVTVQQVCPGRRTSHGALPGDPVVLALLGSALGVPAPAVPDDVDC